MFTSSIIQLLQCGYPKPGKSYAVMVMLVFILKNLTSNAEFRNTIKYGKGTKPPGDNKQLAQGCKVFPWKLPSE